MSASNTADNAVVDSDTPNSFIDGLLSGELEISQVAPRSYDVTGRPAGQYSHGFGSKSTPGGDFDYLGGVFGGGSGNGFGAAVIEDVSEESAAIDDLRREIETLKIKYNNLASQVDYIRGMISGLFPRNKIDFEPIMINKYTGGGPSFDPSPKFDIIDF